MSDTARDQAAAQVLSIVNLVRATQVDYGRLAELRDRMSDPEVTSHPVGTAEELAELEDQAGDCADEDDAYRRIDEDPLSVEYRSGWSDSLEGLAAEEFRIVLCTGGPHVELRGDITDDGGPYRITVHYMGWGECGQYFDIDDEAREALQTYCERFIFS